ncbi:MAG TPA: GyrI-like domain-containing protein [Microbacterium sp.]|nr:GyrI-like domain-containing protein [Microbacterium sp.]
MKTDPKKAVAGYRAARGRFDVVTIAPARFLAIDGEGDPNTAASYRAALETLYPVAYRLRALTRVEIGLDYVVPPLEALWWADDMEAFTRRRDKDAWRWTAMLLVPEGVPGGLVESARDAVAAGRGAPALDALRVLPLDEGLCVQTLHIGPYDEEGPVLADMHERVIPERGLRLTGRHHEIYLGDPRRAAPEKLRTILRQPVARA